MILDTIPLQSVLGYAALISLIIGLGFWLLFTVPFLEKNGEMIYVCNCKTFLHFILDAVKAIYISNLLGRKAPLAIQLHVAFIVFTFLFSLGYLIESENMERSRWVANTNLKDLQDK